METVLKKVNSNSKCLLEYRSMHYYENRLSSFACWPFKENCKCTPESVGLLNQSNKKTSFCRSASVV
uniref:Uncharacterized protein n=1 Tax=Podarcis muralis TaxID=64176 RepID=A0A670I162_PODMU